MKRNVSIFTLTLLLVCMLSTALPLVHADWGGTGKYLTIEIEGGGWVKATKEKSGEIWEFYKVEGAPQTEKVGAGTVLLEAIADPGWEFAPPWEGNLEDNTINPTKYKTQKHGYVKAVFVKRTFTITATAIGPGLINGETSLSVTVESGADSPVFNFVPDLGNHISAIVVDDVSLSSYVESYQFFGVTTDHTIVVYFYEDGKAFAPPGDWIHVFVHPIQSPGVHLTFPTIGGEGGTITGNELTENDVYLVAGWELLYETLDYTGEVDIAVGYDEADLPYLGFNESKLQLIEADSLDAVRSDVNFDLQVDGDDVSDVANAVKHLEWYDPLYDINSDDFVNEDDVHMVNANKGAILIDRTVWVDTEANIIYGLLPHNGRYFGR